MAECKHEECLKEALFKSDFCWEHIQDKREYRHLIVQNRHGLEGANLSGVELKMVFLAYAHLRGANLRGAYLEEGFLWNGDLKGAELVEADLRRADLTDANLEEADLWGANLEHADLRGANLRGVNLVGANLREANLVEANLWGAYLGRANLVEADLREADLRRVSFVGTDLGRASLAGANVREAKLERADLTNADLRDTNFNEANLMQATLTGAKVWGMSRAGCKTENIKCEYLNFDKDGKDSGIFHLNKQQVEEFLRSQPTIEILLQNKLPPYAIRTLLDLIDKINQQNPDWAVELRKFTSGRFFSELTVKTNRDEILEEVANAILGAFKKGYQKKLLEYLPDKKAGGEHALILKKLEIIENKIENPVEQVTIIHSTGKIPVNINFKESEVQVNVFGDVQKMINVEGNYYEISAPQGRDDLIRNLIDQLDSPEIEKRIKEAETQLKGFSPEQVKFLEEQFRESVAKIFKEKQKEVGFFDKVKAFSQRFSESSFAGVIGNAIWFFIKKFALPNM